MKIKTCHILRPVLTAFCLLTAVAISAAPGDLDPTFSGDGKLVDRVGGASGVAIQPDGKIIVAGVAIEGFAVARYNLDGSPDITFGGSGMVTTSFSSEGAVAFSVAVQRDGKIVVAGYACPCSDWGPESIALARYNLGGSLDLSFDGDGKVTTAIGRGTTGYSVVIQPDNKIIVAGSSWIDKPNIGDEDFALVRYNSNGSLDTTFGSGGIVTTSIAAITDVFWAITLQPDGKIVAGGAICDFVTTTSVLVRYNANGSLDTTFGFGGIEIPPFGIGAFETAVTTQTDGKIVAVGPRRSSSGITIVRYTSNGSLDTTFDFDGEVTAPIDFSGADVAIQSDGKIVAAGSSYNGSNYDFAIVRYNPDGSLDNTFGGGDGETSADFNNSNEGATAMALDSTGRLIVVGNSSVGDNSPGRWAISRFLLESQVSISGRVTTPDGRGLRNAVVSITNQAGASRTVMTSSFGNYQFENIAMGQIYTVAVSSKRFRFTAREVQLNAALTNLDFTGQE